MPTPRPIHTAFAFALILAVTLLAACSDAEPSPDLFAASADRAPLPAAAYLALGDSYTIAEGVPHGQGFPEQLAAKLDAAGHDVGEPVIIAQTGWTTLNLLSQLKGRDLPDQPYRLVTLLIGVNDQYQGRWVEDFEPDFNLLLDLAIEAAGGDKSRVVVVNIPDYLATPFGQGHQSSESLIAYNNAIATITNARGIKHVNIYEASKAAADDPTLLVHDQLHPSAKQYAQWVDLILPAAEEALAPEPAAAP